MTKKRNILLIARAERFSPNSVERDAAILRAVADELKEQGHQVELCEEDALPATTTADAILSMGRNTATLRWLARLEEEGTSVVNSARAMLGINRRRLLLTARQLGVATAPFAVGPLEACPLPYPVWWKRDDRVSQEQGDVRLIRNEAEWASVRASGIEEYVVEQHVKGDLVKFYSVSGTPFFHWNYPQFSKFGNEQANGESNGFSFDAHELKLQADRLATASGLTIFGGDAIVTPQGSTRIIDLNDWPSFSSCREEASKAIAAIATPLPCPPPGGRELAPSTTEKINDL